MPNFVSGLKKQSDGRGRFPDKKNKRYGNK